MSFGRNYGFTLVELMTVVAVVSIIAAIAIPILYETRKRAQVNSTIGVLRTITSGQQAYFASIGEYTDLQTLSAQKILDARFAAVPV
jgi:prepilin-type N-terminal cleavage/methylation domain-containing protein